MALKLGFPLYVFLANSIRLLACFPLIITLNLLTILLCSLLISSCVASCRFFSGSSVCNFSYFLAFRPTPIKGANRPEKGPGGMMSDVSVRRLFPVMVKCSFGRALDRYQHANNMV